MIRLRGDLRHRFETGKLGEMVARAAAHEPLIEQVWPQMMEPHIQPLHVPHVARMMTAVYNAQAQAVFQRAKVIVCVNAPRWGAGRRLEGHLAFALAELYGPENVLMVVTDTSGEMPAWKRPENVRFVDLAGEMEGLDEPNRQRALLSFLRSLRPSAVFNVNSRTLWQLLSNYGSVMRQDTPIIGCFFCNDRNVLGFQGGYPASQFYRTFDYVRAMVTDSHFLREDLIRQFVIPQEDQNRMQVLAAPVDPAIPIAPRPETDQAAALRAAQERNRLAMPNATKSGTFLRPYPPQDAAPTRPQVFWAGRLDAQKRLDLLYAVARRLPEADVRVWGEPIAKGGAIEPDPPENLWFEGSYTRFADLPLFDAAAWLYTSAWDGVPSILLEVAMTGLPLVGSDVGGTSEVLHPDLSFPVSPFEDVDSYVNGLRAVLADPDAARSRALALRTRLISTRTDATFRKTVSRLVEGTVF